jgi:hypothetical protein
MLSRISQLVVVVVVYVYFTAWIYVHFYYEQFGISTSMIRIDYKSYLIFSWNVFISLHFLVVTAVAAAAGGLVYLIVRRSKFWLKPNRQFHALIAGLILLFPYLFYHARYTAISNYRDDRIHTDNLRSIQFVFRQQADFMSPAFALDSVRKLPDELNGDMALIRKDSSQQLKLLGESDDQFIILNQPPYDDSLQILPEGYIYFIAKSDVLLSKIRLRSTK